MKSLHPFPELPKGDVLGTREVLIFYEHSSNLTIVDIDTNLAAFASATGVGRIISFLSFGRHVSSVIYSSTK